MGRALMRLQNVDIVELRHQGLEFAKANLAGSDSRVHRIITGLLPSLAAAAFAGCQACLLPGLPAAKLACCQACLLPSLPLAVQRLALYANESSMSGGNAAMHPGGKQRAQIKGAVCLRRPWVGGMI
jgi:hypothetical protein